MKRYLITALVVLLASACCSSALAETRMPAVAGTFYPSDSSELAKMVAGHLNNVRDLPEIDGQLMALIVPHAGLAYSGPIAAHAYKLLEGSDITTAVLCGPAHRVGFAGGSVYGPDVIWNTPLGNVLCNDDICRKLLEYSKDLTVLAEPQLPEHCLEVQLPYLQATLKDFQIVPILMGYPNHELTETVAGGLESILDDDQTVLVASTDWQHYRPAAQGWKLDSTGVDCIKRLAPDDLEAYLKQGRTEACGGAAAVAVMRAAVAKGADKVKILKYGDSGDVTGDKNGVVGYLAAAIYKSDDVKNTPEKPKESSSSQDKYELTATDRETLLGIARTSIDCHLNKKPLPDFEVSEILRRDGAAFVTLTEQGQLRGCIGYTMAFKPLYQTVSECAIKAAVEDPRFSPVGAYELPNLHIEISVLTPLQKVESLDEIKVGRDGLMISLGRQRGLLLPQVATDYGWTETEFLQQTCRKAGLPLDAYLSPNAVIERFQALVFGEGE